MAVLNYHNFDTFAISTPEGPNEFNLFQVGKVGGVGPDVTSHIELSDDYARIGTNSLKFTLEDGVWRDGNPNGPLARSEVGTQVFGGSDNYAMAGWYSFSFLTNYVGIESYSFVISQFFDGGSPSISLRYWSDTGEIYLRLSTNIIYHVAYVTPGEWVDIDFWYQAKEDPSGRIKIWVNGDLVQDITRQNMWDPLQGPLHPHWKLGAYAPGFGNADIDKIVFHFDAISYHNDLNTEKETLDWIDAFRSDPVSIISPVNESNISVNNPIEVITDAEYGDVDLIVEDNVIDTKSGHPYIFTINEYIPRNGAIIDLPFNGNTYGWGNSESKPVLINPQDANFISVDGISGISLGNSSTNNQRSYVIIPSSPQTESINTDFTVGFYIRGEMTSGVVMTSYNSGNNGIRISVLSNGRVEAYLNSETEGDTYRLRSNASHTIDPEVFNHIAITYDGEVFTLYFNWQLSDQISADSVDVGSSSDWFISTSPILSINNLDFSTFRIYDYAIPEEEINKTVEDNFLGQLELKIRRDGITSDPVTINIVEELPTFTISATATTGGNVSGDGEYEENEEVTLTATPDTGYDFVRWEEDSETVSAANPYIFNAEENRVLLAVFQQIEYQLTVTYTAGGTATGSGEYTEGEQVELTATPSSGYIFTGWYRDSALLSTDNPYNYTTRGQADTVQARFELIPIPEYTITVIPSTGGTVTGGGTYEEGKAVTLSAMPQSGWTFVKWSNDATDNPYSFTASENLTISAIFEEVNPEVPYIIVKGKFKIV